MKTLALILLIGCSAVMAKDGEKDFCTEAKKKANACCTYGDQGDSNRGCQVHTPGTEDFKQCVNEELDDLVDEHNDGIEDPEDHVSC